MYTIITLTHILEGNKIQALLSFNYNQRTYFTTALSSTDVAGTELESILSNPLFDAECLLAVAKQKQVIDNPTM